MGVATGRAALVDRREAVISEAGLFGVDDVSGIDLDAEVVEGAAKAGDAGVDSVTGGAETAGVWRGRCAMGVERKTFDSADETRAFEGGTGRVELVNIGGGVVGRATFEPGWKWSEHVKPLAGTESCQAPHLGYVVSGRQAVRMDDGTETEFGPGDVISISPGHDGWTVGDEPCVILDFSGMSDYAKKT